MAKPEASGKQSIEEEGRDLVRMCQSLRMRVNELEERIDATIERYTKATENEKDDVISTN